MTNAGRPVVACVGAGRMGRGIAHAFAYAGHEVRLVDVSSALAKNAPPDSSLISNMNPLVLLKGLVADKKQSKLIHNVLLFEVNKEGTFGVIATSEACLAVFFDLGEACLLEKDREAEAEREQERLGTVTRAVVVESPADPSSRVRAVEVAKRRPVNRHERRKMAASK